MASWTDIADAEVAAGAPLSTALMTALRDNVGGAAAGETGAPRVEFKAIQYRAPEIGSVTAASADSTFLDIDDYDDFGLVRLDFGYNETANGTGVTTMEIRYSDDNGSTWSSWFDIADSVERNNAGIGYGVCDLVAGTFKGFCADSSENGFLSDHAILANANGIQIRVNRGIGVTYDAHAMATPLSGRTAAS